MATGSTKRALVLALLTAATVAACSDDNGQQPGQPLTIAKAAVQNGDGQTGPPDQALPDPLRAIVTQNGQPAANIQVQWAAAAGDSVEPAVDTTGPDGISETIWFLGPSEGQRTATASVSGAVNSPITFTATGSSGGLEPPPPATAGVTVGNNFFQSNHNNTQNPAVDTVAVNGTVTWTWGSGAGSHSVQSTGTPSFTSSAILTGEGQTYSVTFAEAGTYTYNCQVHPAQMTGTIVVR